MSIQNIYTIVFAAFALLQVICAVLAFKSEKPIGKYTGRLNLAIIVPILANMIIIQSQNETLSAVGYYFS